jgi:hypothetical protein
LTGATGPTGANLFGGTQSNNTTSNSATRFLAPFYYAAASATEANDQIPTVAGVFSDFKVSLSGDPGGGATQYAFTVRKNGVDTAIACTIAGTATVCSDAANTVTFAAGDLLSVRCIPSNTPTVRRVAWSAKFVPS